MTILINIVGGFPILCILIFAVGMLGEALSSKTLHTKTHIDNDGCAARAFMSMVCFIIAAVLLIGLVLVNKVL